MRVWHGLFTSALLGALCVAGLAKAADYPNRPITVVVPFAAGGPTDSLARLLADRMGRSLGQSLIIENVGGAAGSIGVARAVQAAPDGYTVLIGNTGTNVTNGALYPLKYDLLKDLDPVIELPTTPLLIVSRNTAPAKSLKELIAWMKDNPGKIAAGTAGVGSPSHIAGILLEKLTGVQLNFVPYKGTGPALMDLIGGQIDVMIDQAANSMPQVNAGTVRPYAVTAKARIPSAPNIPTVDEAGLPGYYDSVWHGMWVPHGVPKEIVAKINAAARDAFADANVQKRFAEIGLTLPPEEERTPEALAIYQKAEIDKWWPIVKSANIKGE